jgi:hypothetical protein
MDALDIIVKDATTSGNGVKEKEAPMGNKKCPLSQNQRLLWCREWNCERYPHCRQRIHKISLTLIDRLLKKKGVNTDGIHKTASHPLYR